MSSMVYIKVQLEASHMRHEDCVWKVRGALANVEGVHEIMVESDCSHAVVGVCPDRVNSSRLIEALRSAGFWTRSHVPHSAPLAGLPIQQHNPLHPLG